MKSTLKRWASSRTSFFPLVFDQTCRVKRCSLPSSVPVLQSKMLVRPDLVRAFALYLEDEWRKSGHGPVAVRADIRKSLNGRPFQQFIDPDADLTTVADHPLRAADWVLPLEIPRWGARDGSTRGVGTGS